MLPQNAWKSTLGELELQMTKATFNTWLKDARLLESDGEKYVIGVRNDYAKDWLENRLLDTIVRTLAAIVGHPIDLHFAVWGDEVQNGHNGNGRQNGYHNGEATRRDERGPDAASVGLRDEYVFSTYVAGPSNRLAHAAALSVAERPGQTYNPLFIYGGVGLGKTHLLHAIGHKCLATGLSVRYVTSEAFTNDLIQSIRSQRMAEFREKYRTPDLLMIDDIQFVAGKESTQEELFHTFNDLHSRGKQVVISSDRPPKAMVTLEERLQSRFEWGLMADIQFPDVETRMAILRTKADTMRVVVPDAVIELIATQVRHNIRELEGALNKVVAYSQLAGTGIDLRLADMALADLINQQDKVSLTQVIAAVCRHYQVSLEALCSSNRSRTVAFPRQMAMYLARTETDASFPQIGAELGNRDHTTIIHGHDKIAEMMDTTPSVRQDLLAIKSLLYNQR
jgi:chromosomal replication initiator protein